MRSDPRKLPVYPTAFRPVESFAQQLDVDDPLRPFRERFHIPRRGSRKRLVLK